MKILDEVRDQDEHIELTEEREEGEVIDSENENEGKNSEQNEKQNTFAEDFLRKKFIVCSSFPFFLSHSPLLIVFLFFHFFLPFMDFFVPVLKL
jgi:hypothetical protein